MKSIAATLVAAAALLPSVSAHGYVQEAWLNNKNYSGYLPYTDPYYSPVPDRIFRPIQGNGPVTDFSLIDVQCGGYEGSGSSPAQLLAPVAAGSDVSLQWTTWPDSHKGPIITYMAKCPGDCLHFLPGSNAVWFKIQEQGKAADGTWASEPLETNVPFNLTIPSALAPGNYVVRHELWALHTAYEYPGAQIFPSCFQVTVTGTGSAVASGDDLVSFPGEYTGTTPGVVYDIYTNTSAYPIPGPAVWTP